MARRSSYPLALLLAGFALGIAGLASWLLAGGVSGEASASAAGGEAPRASAPRSTELSAPRARGPAATEPGGAARDSPELAPRGATEERIDAAEAELADALWVEGRVRLPAATPVGETVLLEAKGRDFEHRGPHRSEPRADGTFRAAFSRKTRTGWLVLHAEHLYLDRPFRLKPASPPVDIVLEAQLGGRIEGQVLAHLAPDERALLVGAEVRLEGEPQGNLVLDDFGLERKTALAEDLSFSFGGLPPGYVYRVDCDSGVVTRVTVRDLSVQPGETTRVELAPTPGARVSGRVVDEQGRPVADVELRVFSAAEAERWRRREDRVPVDEEGRFVERGIHPGAVALAVKAPGRVGRRIDLGELVDAEYADGVEVVLAAGHALAGVVLWPDGEPVSKARVTARQDPPRPDGKPPFPIRSGYFDERERELETGLDGTFRFAGLRPSSVDLIVSAVVPDAKGRRKRSGPRWKVTLEDVAPDSEELVVTLTAGIVLTGRVTDDLGLALGDFTVQAMPSGAGGPMSWYDASQGVARRFRGAGGSFALEGLEAGRWQVRALASGHLECAPVELELAPDGAGLRLVLNRATVLSGLVLDPSGKPVQGASVVANEARASRWERMNNKHADRTDEHGAFTVKRAPVGSVELQARWKRTAPSEVLTLELEPGQVETGITLVLREGARIVGTLVSGAGDTVAGRTIELSGGSLGPLGRHARADAGGAFSFDDLPPGQYQLVGHPSIERVQSLTADGQARWLAAQSARVYADVTIEGGETVHVVLGAPPENPVRVTGVVSRSGRGLEGARVSVRPSSGSRVRSAETDASGSYEVTLDEPGEYTFELNHQGIRHSVREAVPDVEVHVVDFELSASAVSGRVFGPDGKPVERVLVELAATLETAESRSFGVSGLDRTDGDGSFRFEGVAPGAYRLTAGEPGWDSSEQGYGSVQIEVEVAAGEETGGLELQLESGAFVSGTVRDSGGRPVSGAAIYVRGEGGAVISRWPTETDGAGRFRTRALNSGTWTLSARRGAEASPESAPVRLAPGGTAEVDLELGPATLLLVRVRDAEGRPVGAGLAVTDSSGQKFAGLRVYTDSAIYERYDDGFIVVGPLPPGTYEVVASNHDGLRAQQTVQLSGEAEREIQVTLAQEQ